MSDFDLYESEIEELYRPKEEPKIWLTVEEAKEINNLILKLFYNERGRMSVFDATDLLTNRIEQAEKENA